MDDHQTTDQQAGFDADDEQTIGRERGVNRRDLFRGGLAGLTVLGTGGLGGGLAHAAAGRAPRPPLVLKHEGLRLSVARMFAAMRGDTAIRDAFIRNPTDVVLASILPDGARDYPEQRISEANRFLFSLLGNAEFRSWASDYQGRLSEQITSGRLDPESLDKGRIFQDMAGAMARYGGDATMASLMKQANMEQVDLNVEVTVETYIAVAAVLVLVLVLIDFSGREPDEPTSVDGKISSAELRSLADFMTRRAGALEASGRLGDPDAVIR